MSKLVVTTPSELEIVMVRIFDAPRELVWAAMTKPENMSQWWGPRKYKMVNCEMDLRVGGAYRFDLGDDEQVFGFRGEYKEIVPPERLAFTFFYDVEPYQNDGCLETIVLAEVGGKTTLTATLTFEEVRVRDGMLHSGMEEGAGESYDRLEELLKVMA